MFSNKRTRQVNTWRKYLDVLVIEKIASLEKSEGKARLG
jgi:hypothetical protein